MKKDIMGDYQEDQPVRLNRFLSDAGVCSRREADRLIEKGQVTVDGKTALMGTKVMPGQCVKVNGKVVARDNKLILLALNKPKGIVCTSDRVREKNNIIDFVHYPERIYPVGRLDKDSEGLILMTNDGSLVNKIMKARVGHEKEYVVTVDREITEDFIRDMSAGVPILDTVTRPCKVKKITSHSFRIILTQGLNRQIRRMCEHFDYKVTKLQRVRIMNIHLGDLPSGKWRYVTENEMKEMKRMIEKGGHVTHANARRRQ